MGWDVWTNSRILLALVLVPSAQLTNPKSWRKVQMGKTRRGRADPAEVS
jgi:hypothetical protein